MSPTDVSNISLYSPKVIFNPADVGGPDRFSFNETGVWFGAGFNASRALVYHLHPDDARVFQKARVAAEGQTDPQQAAIKVAAAEESLFGYSLNYHSNDVLEMLTSFNEAQCADDANILTSMLRAIGIPAHPATADAALETKAANWTFDTWTEFLVPNGTSPNGSSCIRTSIRVNRPAHAPILELIKASPLNHSTIW